MKGKETIPVFASEADEAAWHFEHQDDLDEYLAAPTPAQIAKASALMGKARRTPAEKLAAIDGGPPTKQIALRVSVSDLEAAKALAARKGIGYQTLLKMAIHEWLTDEERRRA